MSYRDSCLGPSSPQINRYTDYATKLSTRDSERRNIVLLFRLCSLFQGFSRNAIMQRSRKLESVWKEAVKAQLQVLTLYLPEATEED